MTSDIDGRTHGAWGAGADAPGRPYDVSDQGLALATSGGNRQEGGPEA